MLVKPLKCLIRLYQLILSPITGNQCRFHPTCSHYASEALDRHGALKGLILTASRLSRCHPWSAHAWTDTVPDTYEFGGQVFRRAKEILGIGGTKVFRYKRRHGPCAPVCQCSSTSRRDEAA